MSCACLVEFGDTDFKVTDEQIELKNAGKIPVEKVRLRLACRFSLKHLTIYEETLVALAVLLR